MKATDEYKAAVANAIAFKHDHPDENATTAARIHHVNPITVRSNLQREQLPKVKHRIRCFRMRRLKLYTSMWRTHI
jgi:hypothetical protein